MTPEIHAIPEATKNLVEEQSRTWFEQSNELNFKFEPFRFEKAPACRVTYKSNNDVGYIQWNAYRKEFVFVADVVSVISGQSLMEIAFRIWYLNSLKVENA